ncbi:MAG: hypothetical protein RLZZ416_687 [Candidatus Parcubacteria bacterium]|jgi:phosphoribosylamine--glycine ligase
MDILIVGSGGREHALAWKLGQSPRVGKLYIAPGNGGTRLVGEDVDIGVLEFEKLANFARDKQIGLTICSLDDPLSGGIADYFRSRRLRIWGPSKDAAQIESSKTFAKQLMQDAKIPTAQFKTFANATQALAYVRTHGAPIVIKASGLALGKGVYVCETLGEAERAIDEIMVQKVHKDAGKEVVIEDFLRGEEVSIHALTDGTEHITFPPSQDHKRALDNDMGGNTGGMGVIAPVPWVTADMMTAIEAEIVTPAFEQLKKRGVEYKGVLYPGIMMTVDGPRVLEFNARFGDPECQVYMRLLKNDLLDLFEASVDGGISEMKETVEWEKGFAVNIVLASGGYPGVYEKGLPISGLDEANAMEGIVVFHAGTKYENGSLLTNGGRVLGVSATGMRLKEALDRAYEAAGKIRFEGMQYRRDIGAKAL